MNKKIIFIDDSDIDQRIMKVLLSKYRVDLTSAYDADAGIALAREIIPALIIMDLHLPGMQGIEAIHSMRKDPLLKNVVIVVVSSSIQPENKKEALAAGANDYLEKPLGVKLIQLLEAYHILD